MSTKKQSIEMNRLQRINHLVRYGAPVNIVVNEARLLTDSVMDADNENGPDRNTAAALWHDISAAVWALSTRLSALTRENETLKRKLRRDNRKPAKKPQPELLKKEPEVTQQVS
jgi:hypothetical protein